MNVSRRTAIAAIGGASLASTALANATARSDARSATTLPTAHTRPSIVSQSDGIPVTGRVLPGLESLDATVTQLMEAHGVPGAQVAIAMHGKLAVARGYGFADVQSSTPMRPDTPMVLASVSKVVTAQTILKLVDQGRLSLQDRVFERFRELPVPEGMHEDPRLNEITVQMCLQHTGGWDRKASGDPSGWTPRIKRALRIEHAPTPFEMIRYMKGVRPARARCIRTLVSCFSAQ